MDLPLAKHADHGLLLFWDFLAFIPSHTCIVSYFSHWNPFFPICKLKGNLQYSSFQMHKNFIDGFGSSHILWERDVGQKGLDPYVLLLAIAFSFFCSIQ